MFYKRCYNEYSVKGANIASRSNFLEIFLTSISRKAGNFMTTITKSDFGKLSSGENVSLYTFKNSIGAEVEIIDFGGAIRAVRVPDKNGVMEDVVLGYDSVDGYENQGKYIGALIGRHGNRIEDSEFELNGKTYKLFANDGRNNLHGGKIGFDKKLWKAKISGEILSLTYFSPDGEEGFPGNLTVTVEYSFDDDCALKIDYYAVSDADTVCNLTNHCYFNLGGQGSGSIVDEKVRINASKFTVGNNECLPNGEIAEVCGTPLDFTQFHVIGDRIGSDYEQIVFAGGYDHNWCPDGEGLREVADVWDEKTGRYMQVYTDQPGLQFYTGNFLNSKPPFGKGGKPIDKRNGLCLEAQFYPNSLKHTHFPSPILRKGESYRQTTIYKFSVK